MVFFLGRNVLEEGLKTYFSKYKFKNTELSEFIEELSDASKRLGLQINFKEWSDSWLTTAGCAQIELKYERDEETGNFTSFKLVQTPYNLANTKGNRLRVQAFNIAALDENMKLIDTVRVLTSDTASETSFDKFLGH